MQTRIYNLQRTLTKVKAAWETKHRDFTHKLRLVKEERAAKSTALKQLFAQIKQLVSVFLTPLVAALRLLVAIAHVVLNL